MDVNLFIGMEILPRTVKCHRLPSFKKNIGKFSSPERTLKTAVK
jgi:hypothetical protein